MNKKAAIELYLNNKKNVAQTVRELGYPSVPGLISWYRQYKPEDIVRPKRKVCKYSDEEKNKLVEQQEKKILKLKR